MALHRQRTPSNSESTIGVSASDLSHHIEGGLDLPETSEFLCVTLQLEFDTGTCVRSFVTHYSKPLFIVVTTALSYSHEGGKGIGMGAQQGFKNQ